jgi:hypothetical protein
MKKGDEELEAGNVSAARLLYEFAADAGLAQAAMARDGQPPLCEKATGGANVAVVGRGYRGLLEVEGGVGGGEPVVGRKKSIRKIMRPAHRRHLRLIEALKLERSLQSRCLEVSITFIAGRLTAASNYCALQAERHGRIRARGRCGAQQRGLCDGAQQRTCGSMGGVSDFQPPDGRRPSRPTH